MSQTVFPSFGYKDASAAIDWLSNAFGFEKQAAHEGPDGSIVHAEMSYGPSKIMLGQAGEGGGSVDAEEFQGVYVVVADPDAHYAKAKSAGAEIIRELNDTDYGSREYGAKDLDGFRWYFGTYDPSNT